MFTQSRSGLSRIRYGIANWLTRQYVADAPEIHDVLEGPDSSTHGMEMPARSVRRADREREAERFRPRGGQRADMPYGAR